jgi:threonine dehydratase
MPEGTPFVKVQRTQVLGARVVQHGDSLEAAGAEARRIASDEGRTLIHPYDDPAVVAGQGTVALELLADHPDIDTMVVPVGGGGLLAGIAIASRALAPDVRLFGAQSERYPSMVNEIKGRHDPVGGTSIADGIAVPKAGALTSRIIGELVDDVLTVSEEHIEEAMNLLLEIEKIVVEGAGAVGIAALIEHRSLFEGHRVGVVLSGGNVDPRLLASVIMRGLVRNGRLSRLQIEVKDAPGALGKVTTVLGEAGANIVEISHQRMFVDVSARSAELEVVVETLDHDHLERVAEALREAGFEVRIGTFTFGP